MDREETFDLLLPGYNYCGPFNKLNNGEPTNPTDAACKRHDEAYAELGNSAYFYFNEADEKLLEEIKDNTDYGARVAKRFFETKRLATEWKLPFNPEAVWKNMGKEEEKWKAFMHQKSLEDYEANFGIRKKKNLREEPSDLEHKQAGQWNNGGAMDVDSDYITPEKKQVEEVSISPEGMVRKVPRELFGDENAMDTSDDTAPSLRMTAGTTSAAAKGNHETAISDHAPQYGLKETATVILPYQCQCTVIGVSTHNQSPTKLELRLNSPYDPFMTGLSTWATGANVFSGVFSENFSTPASVPVLTFPTARQYPQPVSATERPWWRDYWAKHYLVYAVVECEVTITIKHAVNQIFNENLVCFGTDVYGTTDNNKFPTNGTYALMRNWPGLTWKRIRTHSDGTNPNATQIHFTWKPGNLNKPVTNDEDVKTWTTIAANPTLTESLVLFFFKSFENSLTDRELFKLDIDMRYKVQFKDLKNNIYYPVGTNADPPNYTNHLLGSS